MALLEIKGLCKDFGGLRAIDSLDLAIEEGQIFGLIGPNGAGKSTAFNCVAGVYAPTAGDIRFDGASIAGEKPWNLCKLGLGRTFQIVKPFATKSVLFNVMIGAFARTDHRDEAEAKADEVLRLLHLDHARDKRSGSLTIADRKRLEIAKALATSPRLLLLDEVMAGLRPTEVDEMIDILKGLQASGVTIFVIEHIMRAIMALSDRIAVLQFGRKICEGTPDAVACDENVIKAYLGEDYAAS